MKRYVFSWIMFAAVFWTPAAYAAACISPKTQSAPVPYKSAKVGTNLIFKIINNPDSKYKETKHERYRVKSVKGDSVRWYREPMHGKGPNEDITMYRAFGRTAGNDWIYKFDLKKLDKLWPLKQGNEASYVISARQKKNKSKEIIKLKAHYCVRGSKDLKIEAGTYKAHLVDTTVDLLKGPKSISWDRIEVSAWYVDPLGECFL